MSAQKTSNKEISAWIAPKVERDYWYEVETYDGAIRHSARHKQRAEVALSIKILHRQGFDRPVDDCELSCLKEMQEKLKIIGAQHEAWDPTG